MTPSLKIDDLSLNEDLDREAMAQVTGGARRGIAAPDMLAATGLTSRVQGRFAKAGSHRRLVKSRRAR